MMLNEELSQKIWGNLRFHNEYKFLQLNSLRKTLGIDYENVDIDLVRRLLQVATTFAGTRNWMYREKAYKIAISVLELDIHHGTLDNIPTLVRFILDRMGNFPSRNLFSKYKLNPLPMGVDIEIASHEMDNTVIVTNNREVVLTDFQKNLWNHLDMGSSLSVSAPTSAGKSFTLQYYLISKFSKVGSYKAVYLVPTRALINQVSSTMIKSLNSVTDARITVTTVPLTQEELGSEKILYVLTQERLQLLSQSEEQFKFDLAVIDESQLLGESSRGVILQTVVEKMLKESTEMQVMFASPLTSNPSVLPYTFNIDEVEIVNEDESPVSQNLIFIDTSPTDPNSINISAFMEDEKTPLGSISLEKPILDSESGLAVLTWHFGKTGKNLVYASGPAACEKIASLITDEIKQNIGVKEFKPDPDLLEFSEFVKEHIHDGYTLAETLPYGVAFHYGNIPTLVRKTIEEFFDEGKLSFLVCTSTLLHGINLPAKNLFMLNPTRGKNWSTGADIPIQPVDFWNLAGRAGRMGRDFQGNVFLINIDDWISNPLTGQRKQEIVPSLFRNLSERFQDIIEYIDSPHHPSGNPALQGIENTFVKLYNDYKSGSLNNSINRIEIGKQQEIESTLIEKFISIDSQIDVPKAILEKNISISPLRQQEMLNYIVAKIKEKGPERVIPVHPLIDWESSIKSLSSMFKRIHSRFEKIPGKDKSQFYFAPLALRWMRGDSLARLIDDAYNFRKKKMKRKSTPSINTVVREVMDDIEQDLRFRYVKYTSCYVDLLIEGLARCNKSEYVPRIPSIPLFLELGASSNTMVNFIGHGISRTTAGLLTEKTTNKNMDRQEVIDWLKQTNLESHGLPTICILEIKSLLQHNMV